MRSLCAQMFGVQAGNAIDQHTTHRVKRAKDHDSISGVCRGHRRLQGLGAPRLVRPGIGIELQDAITHEPWPLQEAMRIRVALHTGEAELRGGDYFGRAVNRAARLRSLAAGGQILCSGATGELVIDSLPDDVVLADLPIALRVVAAVALVAFFLPTGLLTWGIGRLWTHLQTWRWRPAIQTV